MTTDMHVTLPDGHELAFTDIGDPEGNAVFFFHGAPGSRLILLPWASQFADRELRVISLDRPGYGKSSGRPGRTLADWPADVARVADTLGIERFIVAGHSSGGPYAVACAALLADRTAASVILAGVTDMGWPRAWDGFFEVEAALMRMPDERSVEARCAELFGADGSRFLEAPGLELSEPDMELLADEGIADAMVSSMTEAFRQGVRGYAQDVFVQGHAWPFAAGSIATPTIVAHGDVDAVVPVDHARHMAELIPGSALRILPGQGHFTIVSELPDLCAELARSVRASR